MLTGIDKYGGPLVLRTSYVYKVYLYTLFIVIMYEYVCSNELGKYLGGSKRGAWCDSWK